MVDCDLLSARYAENISKPDLIRRKYYLFSCYSLQSCLKDGTLKIFFGYSPSLEDHSVGLSEPLIDGTLPAVLGRYPYLQTFPLTADRDRAVRIHG
ncbi:hypothetical protein VTO42DRAFT_7066 [Malbranchea cinnamomea]